MAAKKTHGRVILFIILFFCLPGSPFAAYALEPVEVLVLANPRVAGSREIADYYMQRRGIPEENLLLLPTTKGEACSRKTYEEDIVQPLKKYFAKPGSGAIRCIVTMYGLPLKILSPVHTAEERKTLHELQVWEKSLVKNLKNAQKSEAAELEKRLVSVREELKYFHLITDRNAAFDSELALVKKEKYELGMWLPNPHYLGNQKKNDDLTKEDVVMTARLDGPDPATVQRIIDDTLKAEKEGIDGTVCIDARWPDPGDNEVSGYTLYDRSLHRAYRSLRKNKTLKVKLNDASELFQDGECPDTAFYSGWYSLANYVDAFDWRPGSIGYHIASAECRTLKAKGSNVWCKRMLEDGVSATIGPVGEPYLEAFPPPDMFFALLLEGGLDLAEVYIRSSPYLSWKMVLVGDPLYQVNFLRQ